MPGLREEALSRPCISSAERSTGSAARLTVLDPLPPAPFPAPIDSSGRAPFIGAMGESQSKEGKKDGISSPKRKGKHLRVRSVGSESTEEGQGGGSLRQAGIEDRGPEDRGPEMRPQTAAPSPTPPVVLLVPGGAGAMKTLSLFFKDVCGLLPSASSQEAFPGKPRAAIRLDGPAGAVGGVSAVSVLLVPEESATAALPFLSSQGLQWTLVSVPTADLEALMARAVAASAGSRPPGAPDVLLFPHKLPSGARVAYLRGPGFGGALGPLIQVHQGASAEELALSLAGDLLLTPGTATLMDGSAPENDPGPPPRFPTLRTEWAETTGGNVPLVINSREAIPIRTELFEGRVLLMMKPSAPEDDPYYHQRIFNGKKRMFECQVQGRFLKQPQGMVYIGAEVTNKMQARMACTGRAAEAIKGIPTDSARDAGGSPGKGEGEGGWWVGGGAS